MMRVFVRSLSSIALAAGIVLPATAQEEPPPPVTYPVLLDRPNIVSWLGKETDVRPETVAAVTPEAVVAILQQRVVAGAVAVVIRGEVLKQDVFARDGVLSWHATVQVDCAGKKVRQGVTTGYAARNLLFDGKPVRAADTDWRIPVAGEPLDQVRRAVCETGFQPPLTAVDTAAVVVSTPSPVAAAPKPLPATAKPAPKPKLAAAPAAPHVPPPAPPAAPKPVAKPAAPAPAASPPPAPAAKTVAKVSAQIAAGGSDAEAGRALERVKAHFADRMTGLETRVVRAVVNGKTYHRAIVLGFPDRASAAAFCVALQAGDQACFVRGDLG